MYVPLGSCTKRHEAVVVSWPFLCSSLLGSVMSSHADIRDNLSHEIERADNEGSELMSKRVERGGRKGRRGQDRRDEGDERGGRKAAVVNRIHVKYMIRWSNPDIKAVGALSQQFLT